VRAGSEGALAVAPPTAARRTEGVPVESVALLDGLLFLTLFTITFTKVAWEVGGAEVSVSDVLAALFVLVFALTRLGVRDWLVPRTTLVLGGFFAAFALVYLIGFFNLSTADARDLFAEGFAKFGVHFAFLVAAVAYVARRSERFYWWTLACFVAGIAANAVYGLVQLVVAETTTTSLDEVVLGSIGSFDESDRINVFGTVAGSDVYRTNALTMTPNHLGVMLLVPLLLLLPVYLRLERRHRLRVPLALLLVLLALIELSTLSRTGLLGLVVGLAVLAVPYRRHLPSARLLVPLVAAAGVVAIVFAERARFFEGVIEARTGLGSGEQRIEIWGALPSALGSHPLFGLGLNTFTDHYEFLTGRGGIGPHSYYVALLSETGVVGTALALFFLVYLFRRLGVVRELGRALAAAGDAAATRIRPLGWGLTAGFVGTLAANAFLMTIPLFYFFAFALLAISAPLVFSRRSAPATQTLALPSSECR
jgi:O-antigen ligase/polysaccharide polymerase Wzy-like membrane protein